MVLDTQAVCTNKSFFRCGFFLLTLMGVFGAVSAPSHANEFFTLDATWRPKVEFSDRGTGDVAVRVRSDSPAACGIQMIEVGVNDPVTGQFEPRLGLLRDTYDQSYPGVAPKLRRLYSYDLEVSLNSSKAESSPLAKQSALPPGSPTAPGVILDTDTIRTEVLAKVLYSLTRTAITCIGNPIASGGALALDQFIEHIIKKRAFNRAQSLYFLKLIATGNNPELTKNFGRGELERLIAMGNDDELKDLLISEDYQEFAYMAQNDALRLSRLTNYANLLSALNREGLIAQPLFRDFVMVYYDPKREYARKIDLTYLDLDVSPETALLRKSAKMSKDGLLPLGIFALGNVADRVLQYDFLKPERLDERSWARYFARLGANAGTAFIPFPFSLVVRPAKAGIEFVLTKVGRDIFVDTVKNEGELLALLDSGVIELDPSLLKEVKGSLRSSKTQAALLEDPIGYLLPEQGSARFEAYRKQNEANMGAYLSKQSSRLCYEIGMIREHEFRDEFLTAGESFKRGMGPVFGGPTGKDYVRQRQEIIKARLPLIEARSVLDRYDPYLKFTQVEVLVNAIRLLGQSKDSEDVARLTHLLKVFSDSELISETLGAIGAHGDGNLADGVCAYLETYRANLNPGLPPTVADAIVALKKLNYQTASDPEKAFARSLDILKRLRVSRDANVRELANDALFVVADKQLSYLHL